MSLMNTAEQSKRQLNKLAFDPQLTPGARNAVRVCLRVLPSEKVTVITDEVSLEIAAAIVRELEAVGLPVPDVGAGGCGEASVDGFAAARSQRTWKRARSAFLRCRRRPTN
jgi:hypothetical protein